MVKKQLDPSNPVVAAFLAISTGGQPVTDEQIVAIIKKNNQNLHYITRDSLNALLGKQNSDTVKDAINGFIRKSYVVDKHSSSRSVRCEYVVYGGVGPGGKAERHDKVFKIMNTEPRWRNVASFKSPAPGAGSRSQEASTNQTPVLRRPAAAGSRPNRSLSTSSPRSSASKKWNPRISFRGHATTHSPWHHPMDHGPTGPF
jgi:hypothetical protein